MLYKSTKEVIFLLRQLPEKLGEKRIKFTLHVFYKMVTRQYMVEK